MRKIICLIFALISFGSVNGQPAASWSDGGKYVGELKSGNKKKEN